MIAEWDIFFREKVIHLLRENKSVIDIGGGLRAVRGRGNRYDPARAWIAPLLARVKYQILDPVADYHPDIVGDIHTLPFIDNSQDAYVCLAILEHVEDPRKAVREMYRTLVPGGQCLVYVPFLYYYHAEQGYYHDYWRFTEEGVRVLFRDFKTLEIQPVRGAVETWLRVSPLGKYRCIALLGRMLDTLTGKSKSKQVSGYYIYAVK